MPTVLGILKTNSVDFVRRVFSAYEENTLFAALDGDAALPAVPGYETGEIYTPAAGGGWFDQPIVQRQSEEFAQIVFSSGTEGKAKAIIVSHAALANTVDRLNAVMAVDGSIREYIGVPVTFSFGLARCRAVAAAGGQFYIPERGFDPLEIRRMLESGAINALSAVPTLLRTLLRDPEVLSGAGARVKWLEIGSQFMSRAEKEAVKALFPNAVIVQHYGLTEASRTTFLLVSESRGRELESVGSPFGGPEVRISDTGRIMIRGPHLASGLVEDGRIVPLVDADGWLTTGDMGHLEDGNLFFDGRADDVINSGGIKVDPGQLEDDVKRRLGVNDGVAIAGIPDPLRGEGFLVAVTGGLDPKAVESAVHSALTERGVVAGSSVHVQSVANIPHTPTGKVQRKQLAALYQEVVVDPSVAHNEGAGIKSLYSHMFQRHEIPPTATFQDLGGDSLNYIQMAISLEKEMGTLPANWDTLAVSELERLAGGTRSRFPAIESNVLLRALAITAVVITHAAWNPGLVFGGTQLLFFLIGFNLARFKSSALTRGDIWGPLASYIRVLLVPYALFSALFMLQHRNFYPDLLFAYTNLVEVRYSVVFPYWFVQVLLQTLILTGFLFLVPTVRKYAVERQWPFAIIMASAFVGIWFVSPAIWDTGYIDHNVPQRYLAILWLGWCCYQAKTSGQRLQALVLGMAFALIDYRNIDLARFPMWIMLGVVTVLFLPTIRVPKLLRDAAQIIGAATFHIFVLNGIFIYVSSYVLGLGPPVAFVIAFVGSIVAFYILAWATDLYRRLRAAKP